MRLPVYLNADTINILHSSQDAEECVNDAYLGIWNAIPPARPNPLLAFLCRIVRNLSLMRYHGDRAVKRGGGNYTVALEELEGCLASPRTVEGELEEQELLSSDFQYLSSIDDEAAVKAILELFSGKVNHGLEENGRMFAQAWYDAYGNDDICYSEESGTCVAKDPSLSDKAHELWNEGERIVQITTDRGFGLMIDYFPAVRVFTCRDSYYELSDSEVESLNALLGCLAEQKE